MVDLDRTLRKLEQRDPPELWSEIERRSQSMPAEPALRRRWAPALIAFVAAVASVTLVVTTFGGRDEGQVVGAFVAERIDLGIDYRSTDVVASDGRLWMLTTDADHGWQVASVDPETLGARTFSLGLADTDGALGDLAVGAGSVWVTFSPLRNGSYDTEPGLVLQIDPVGGEIINRIAVGHRPTGITVVNGALWVAEEADNRVVRIDASTGHVIDAIDIVGGPRVVAAAFGWIWVETAFDDPTTEVVRLDPLTGEATGSAESVHNLAIGLDSLFVTTKPEGAVRELDPGTLAYDERNVDALGQPAIVIAGDGEVWFGRWFEDKTPAPGEEVTRALVRSGEFRFYRVDPDSLQPTGEFVTACPSPGGAELAYGSLWFACVGDLFRVPLG